MPDQVRHHPEELAAGVDRRQERAVDGVEHVVQVRGAAPAFAFAAAPSRRHPVHVEHARADHPRAKVVGPVAVRVVHEELGSLPEPYGLLVGKVKVVLGPFAPLQLGRVKVGVRRRHVGYHGVVHAGRARVDEQDGDDLHADGPPRQRPLVYGAEPVHAALRPYVVRPAGADAHVVVHRPVEYGQRAGGGVERVVHGHVRPLPAPLQVEEYAVAGAVHDGRVVLARRLLGGAPKAAHDALPVDVGRERRVRQHYPLPVGVEHDGGARGVARDGVVHVGV